MHKAFQFFLLLSILLPLFSETEKFSDYNLKEPVRFKMVTEFLSSEKIHYFVYSETILLDGKIHSEIAGVVDFLHAYAVSARKWKGSREFFRVLLQYSEVLPQEFLLKILEMVFSAFPIEFADKIEEIYNVTQHPKILSISYLYLKNAGKNPSPDRLKSLQEPLPHLLLREEDESNLPPLIDLFRHWKTDRKVAIVLRLPQKKLSYLYLRGEGDRWIRFPYPVNTLSVTGLPFFLTNGNTPQGLYKFKKIVRSSNPRIGPSPAIQLALPYETSASDFFGNPETRGFGREEIASLLPESWKDFEPAYQTMIAGKLGRSGIWIHGSTLNPSFFSKKKHGLTWTYGCISLPEIWEQGKLKQSAQEKLLQVWNADYVFVVEILKENLESWEELEEWLRSPENRG